MDDRGIEIQNMYLYCEDNYIRKGLDYLHSVVVKPGLDINEFPGGLIAIVPGQSSISDRVRMLSLSRLLPLHPYCHGVVLHDSTYDTECRFSRLNGLPIINLK